MQWKLLTEKPAPFVKKAVLLEVAEATVTESGFGSPSKGGKAKNLRTKSEGELQSDLGLV